MTKQVSVSFNIFFFFFVQMKPGLLDQMEEPGPKKRAEIRALDNEFMDTNELNLIYSNQGLSHTTLPLYYLL